MKKVFLTTIFLLAVLMLLTSCNLPSLAPTPCAFVESDNNTPDVDKLVQDELAKIGIHATAKTKNYGESGGETCSYHEIGVSAEITTAVPDISDLPALTALAAKVETVLNVIPAKHKFSLNNSGTVIVFTNDTGGQCIWDFANGKCR